MLLEIGQEWKNLTKGKVRMKIYAGGIVGDERDMVRKCGLDKFTQQL